MRTISLYVLLIALSAGSAATVESAMRTRSIPANANTLRENSAPFRDGLYLGQLAARNGDEPRIAVGRWAREQNRAAFREGYQRGYGQALIHRARAQN
ncbi:MAG TPA: hypothetical protein VEN79_03285 [Terriglobia bacterium]|nr:hypothetical protein [Terriglobia bacterium]